MDFLFWLFFLPALGAGLLAAICFTAGAALLVSASKEFGKAMAAGALARSAEPPVASTTAPMAADPATAEVRLDKPTSSQADATSCNGGGGAPVGKVEREYMDVPGLGLVRIADYETRADGQLVRKDRWETGMRNIAGILTGPRAGFEIEEVVEKVRAIAQAARADYESGGNGVPGSAPKWGPCPAQCSDGQVPGKLYEDCPTCEGRARVVVEPPTVSIDKA